MRKAAVDFICCLLLALGAGCASGAKAENMVPETLDVVHRYPYNVAVATVGGQETNPMWSSQISDAEYATAVRSAIARHNVFKGVIDPGSDSQPDYRLEIKLLDLAQPLFGFDMTVDLLTEWSLVATTSSELVWKETVRSSHTATVGDAFAGIKRLRLANEGAGKDSIRLGLESISALPLPRHLQ